MLYLSSPENDPANGPVCQDAAFPENIANYFSSHFQGSPPEELITIVNKVLESQRLTPSEGVYLLSEVPSEILQMLANLCRELLVGNTVYYASTLFLYPTNLCELSCRFCSFYAKPGWKSAWIHSPKDLAQQVRAQLDHQLTEVHIVGGLWHECDLPYYQELFGYLQEIDPNIHIKALTAVEFDYLARLHKIPVEEVFRQMMSWGLGSLPGGGAEMLVESVRKKLAPEKISSDEYLEIHRQAHHLSLRSNMTMLCGHIEKNEDIITHLCRVRSLQDETLGINTFTPLKYHVENNALGRRIQPISDEKLLRIYAVSRLMLDNVPNIKVLWNYTGIDTALLALAYGANDLASTALEEKVIVMAGGIQVKMNSSMMEELIKRSRRTPQKINSGYHHKKDWPENSPLHRHDYLCS